MGFTKLKLRDLNRYRKIYPYLRKEPSLSYTSDKELQIEVGKVTFSNQSQATHIFSQVFSTAPTITAISVDSSSNNSANVNVFVNSVSRTQVILESSENFTGEIHFQAIMIGTS
jgi:hypothetical protein|tara:strand:- start:2 stop:343 length:342 start_codon:yes stop_codon:yes gene_type:complete